MREIAHGANFDGAMHHRVGAPVSPKLDVLAGLIVQFIHNEADESSES